MPPAAAPTRTVADLHAAGPVPPSPAAPPNKGGRPPVEVNAEQVETLAGMNCTMKEIAAFVGCSVDTLERRFADTIEKGREHGKASLKRVMYTTAMSGNITMQIWLSKQMLGYADRLEQRAPEGTTPAAKREMRFVISAASGPGKETKAEDISKELAAWYDKPKAAV